MNRFMRVVLLFLAGLVLVSWQQALGEDQKPKVVALLRARLEAARQTYQALAKNYMENRPPIGELLYRWSCRWLESERELSDQKEEQMAAFLGHLNRMKDLERITKDRWRERFIPIEESTAAQFYRAEAEIWLARIKDR
jgi:hypothetical protein